MAWSADTCILSFRGTSSLTNVLADLQVVQDNLILTACSQDDCDHALWTASRRCCGDVFARKLSAIAVSLQLDTPGQHQALFHCSLSLFRSSGWHRWRGTTPWRSGATT